jgi:hypothetical protein
MSVTPSGIDPKTFRFVAQCVSLSMIRCNQWRTQEFFRGEGDQQIQLRTEGRENGDLGVVAL